MIYSVGHSTRGFDELVELLKGFEVAMLADIRRFPGSRRFPHFNREHLAAALPAQGIEYIWMEELGGRRAPGRKQDAAQSPNLALRNASFRAYADYMQTSEFAAAADRLLDLAQRGRVAIMCSEAVYWRCHRRLVSDYLLTRGVTVQHIMAPGQVRPHVLTEGGVLREHTVVYPSSGDDGEQAPLFTSPHAW